MIKIKISKKISENFEAYVNKFNRINPNSYSSDCENEFVGKLEWTNPNDVLWLYCTENEEGYEGNQTQIGVQKDGTIVWSYYSHCSCYGYENFDGEFKPYEETDDHTQKNFKMEGVEPNILKIIKERLKRISKRGLKDE